MNTKDSDGASTTQYFVFVVFIVIVIVAFVKAAIHYHGGPCLKNTRYTQA